MNPPDSVDSVWLMVDSKGIKFDMTTIFVPNPELVTES